ncbi:MAG: sel1 repeat family protein [Legionellales bacterium]|nr:sel1 repeat family protein [Legionellales bacterium]
MNKDKLIKEYLDAGAKNANQPSIAHEYYLKAAELGCSEAYFLIGESYVNDFRKNNKAIKWYRKAASLGHLKSMESLADLLLDLCKRKVKRANNNSLSVDSNDCPCEVHAHFLIKAGADKHFIEAFNLLDCSYKRGGNLASFYFSNGRRENWIKIIDLINGMRLQEAA